MRFEKKQIPNILTIARMIMAVAIVILLLVQCHSISYTLYNPFNEQEVYSEFYWTFTIAGILFVLASITDAIDGHLARKNNWITDFGKLWDPIADKILINSVLICFGYLKIIPIWISIIMISRDIIVDASRMVAANKNIVVAANKYGKLKTITQMIAIIFIFFFMNAAIDSSPDMIMYYGLQNLMMYVALFFSVLSGIIYVANISKTIKNENINK